MLLQLSLSALVRQTRGVQKAGEKKGSAKTRLESFFSQDYFFFRVFLRFSLAELRENTRYS